MILVVGGALFVGLSLGLLGAGGSAVTVPILVYVVGQPEKIAIAGSLLIVGCVSLAGALPCIKQRRVDWGSVLFFGFPGLVGAYTGAYAAQFVSGTVQMTVFGVLVCVAGFLILTTADQPHDPAGRIKYVSVGLAGLGVGTLTGFVGVGGGFLIVPALVVLCGLPMHRAVATSMAVITITSLTGFYRYLDVLKGAGLSLDWQVIVVFLIAGILGSVTGSLAAPFVPRQMLRRCFAVLLVVVGVGVLLQNFS